MSLSELTAAQRISMHTLRALGASSAVRGVTAVALDAGGFVLEIDAGTVRQVLQKARSSEVRVLKSLDAAAAIAAAAGVRRLEVDLTQYALTGCQGGPDDSRDR